jgi:hypothetical protein
MTHPSLEETLDGVRTAVKKTAKAAKDLDSSCKALDEAAAKGELGKLRSALTRASALCDQLTREMAVVRGSWPATEAEEEAFLEQALMAEVTERLSKEGVAVHRYGSGWSASPVLLRLDLKARALRIDRAKVTSLRPSIIASAILAAKQRPAVRPDQFIELLQAGYHAAVGSLMISDEPARLGSAVPLSEVYKALTLLPDAKREYPLESFTRDLFVLDGSGLSTTKDGSRLFLSASTSSKGGGGVLTVLDDQGSPQNYFAVAFRRAEA